MSTKQVDIDNTFLGVCSVLHKALPDADLHHVGSTALHQLLCRGIVNLAVLVDSHRLEQARAIVSTLPGLSELPMPVDLQLGDKHKPCSALTIRECFAQSSIVIGEFLHLQKAFIHRTGKAYPIAKAEFFTELLQANPDLGKAGEHMPYRVEVQSDRLRIVSALACAGQEQAAYRQANREHLAVFAPNQPAETFSASYWQEQFAKQPLEHWRKEAFTFLCYHKSSEQLIGNIRLWDFQWSKFRSCQLGYNLDSKHQGQGLMTEATSAVIDYLFETWGVHRITAAYDPTNFRSAKLLERLGFVIEGLAKDYIELDGRWHDGVLVALTRQ